MIDSIMTFVQKLPPWLWITFVVHFAILGTVAYLILLERKTASWVQDRIGPNRVGPWGLLQPIADGLKFILKEDYRPKNVDKILFTIAPAVMIIVVILSIAVIPWGGVLQHSRTVSVPAGANPAEVAQDAVPWGTTIIENGIQPVSDNLYSVTYRYAFQIADLNVGVLFVLGALSLAIYGVVIGGWASNNKYSFLGGLRAAANMISYEIPLGLAVLTVVVMYGSLDLGVIVEKQAFTWAGFIPGWNVFCQPVTFLLFLVCIHAEANRAPFDTAEAEQELVGGYHTEYSAMRFALFFLAEYAGMITTSAVLVALFLGGWHLPYLTDGFDQTNPALTDSLGMALFRSIVFFTKTLIVVFIFMWTRWSLPRFRFDQIMQLAWRGLIPISLVLMLGTALAAYAFTGPEHRPHMRVGGTMALALLGINVLIMILTAIGSFIVPAAPDTNRKIAVPGSRFTKTPLPAGGAVAARSA